MCADLEVIDDNVVEMDEESLTLSLSADDPSVTTTTITSATVVIRENDNDGNIGSFTFTSCIDCTSYYCCFIVSGSVALNSSNYDAYESAGEVNVCVVIMAEALERSITVQLSSQDSTARSIIYTQLIMHYKSLCAH